MATATKPETPATSPKHPKFTLTVARSVLREALGKLLSVIPTAKVSVPIAACVLIDVPDTIDAMIARANDGPRVETTQLSGTNFDAILALSMPAQVTGYGRAALPAKKLADFVASLPAGAAVSIAIDGQKARVSAGRSTLNLAGMDPSEFPLTDPIRDGRVTTVPADAFGQAMGRATRFVSDVESDGVLKSVCLDVADGQLLAVASDRFILCRLPIGSADADGAAIQSLFTRDTVASLPRLFGGLADGATLTITADEYRARIEAPGVTAQLRLVAGVFPPYQRLIPMTSPHVIVCERATLIAAVKRVALADEARKRVALTLAAATWGEGVSELWARAASEQGGTAEDVIAVESHERAVPTGDSTPFSLDTNAPKLITALDALSCERVRLAFSGPARPIVIRDADADPASDPTLVLVMALADNQEQPR